MKVNKIKSSLLSISCKAHSFIEEHSLVIFIGIILCLMSGVVSADDSKDAGKDYGAKLLPAVKKTFGSGSSFESMSYIAQVGVCMYKYISSQNIVWFLGCFLLPMFSYAFFN